MAIGFKPTGPLESFVSGCWITAVGDQSVRVRGTPFVGGVIAFELGEVDTRVGGVAVQHGILAGSQTGVCNWDRPTGSELLLVLLNASGMTRLFPGLGAAQLNRVSSLTDLLDPATTMGLHDQLMQDRTPQQRRAAVEHWLLQRIQSQAESTEISARVGKAEHSLRSGSNVIAAAEAANVSRRHLDRLFQQHLGLSPRQLSDIDRIQRSLLAVQRNAGDPVKRFADQAHQARCWRKRLGITPGAYRRTTAPLPESWNSSFAFDPELPQGVLSREPIDTKG